ncbi:MAG TPA: helix-turn-helix transcriptional regulator, partial [Candidatus Krumholzibacterium sp.]|nr:helix-turn-helix transcriptional regulator [Candidatus Krumholzibacterium sp.]
AVSYFLVYAFIIGFSYAALAIWLALMGKRISRKVFSVLAVLAAFFLIGPLLEPLFPRDSTALKIHFNFFENFGLIFVLMEFGLVISMPFKAKKIKDREMARVVKVFSYLYLSRYPVVALTILLPQPFRLFFGLLYPNLVPLIWVQRYLLPWFRAYSARTSEAMDLTGITARYGLSPRESEILGLIMQGKSNRDMEESLFISYHTVKNHVYSIYRKLGVKSRFELLHLINTSKDL